MKFVPLPKGTFYMGWNGKPGSAKKTEIKADFEIAVHTVTQGQWQELMGNNPSKFSRNGEYKNQVDKIKDEELQQFPVECVSWNDAQKFIKKLNDKEAGRGYEYRLPTEAEWEYGCRGGATSEEECSFHFYLEKPTNDLSSREANFNGLSPAGNAEKGPQMRRTTKVGSYPPNKLGLYDMNGNVVQWCADPYTKVTGDYRVLRGKAFSSPGAANAGSSFGTVSFHRDESIGFRLVRVSAK